MYKYTKNKSVALYKQYKCFKQRTNQLHCTSSISALNKEQISCIVQAV